MYHWFSLLPTMSRNHIILGHYCLEHFKQFSSTVKCPAETFFLNKQQSTIIIIIIIEARKILLYSNSKMGNETLSFDFSKYSYKCLKVFKLMSLFYMNLWVTQPGHALTIIVKMFNRKFLDFV